MNSEKQQAAAAAEFAKKWAGKGNEKSQSQVFWMELLTEVYGVNDPFSFIRFEEKVKVDKANFIDGHIPSTKVLIEQKSIDKDLRLPILQSDGSKLTPFQQAKRYVANLPLSAHPRWVVTCNFAEFLVYDMEQPNCEPQQILLENLGKEYYRLQFLVNEKSEHIKKEEQVSMQAGQIVGRIYDALKEQYADDSPEAQRWLNILCVRLVFCLYAEDAGIFTHDQFCNYLSHYEADDFRNALIRLFDALRTPEEKRSKYLKDDLKAFPYTNGGLFEEEIEIPQFTEQLRDIIIHNASLDFDWSEISPTIFGAVFESTLNPETRRSGGMHYTSIENIHKVIDPLFLNDLRRELDTILEEKVEKQRVRKLEAYQDKLASLTFLDPACGSGNFLTETYLSLRRLENEAIRERFHGQSFFGFEEANPIKVSINQFYGIEINDFAVTVATTALWISESQMMTETERIIHKDIDFLPLKSYTNIKEGNALRVSWDEWEINDDTPSIITKQANVYPLQEVASANVGEPVVAYGKVDIYAEQAVMYNTPKEPQTRKVTFDYIMGNPPFVGARWMSKKQKEDVISVFSNKWSGVGDLDYVACWYKLATDIAFNTGTKVAFVSTNSITQGGSVTNLWKPLFEKGIKFNFAWRTFRWDNESSEKAHVHCVIIGFSFSDEREKTIYINNQQLIKVNNINGYLLDAPNIFIEKRMKPLCDVPMISLGGQPIDDGNFILTREEKEDFVRKEPFAIDFIRPFMMGKDFIDRKPRYCLWLKGANPSILRKCPLVLERVANVKAFRLSSERSSTLKAAEEPTLFGAPFECKSNYIAMPKVSSENRKYIPMDYLTPDIIPGDKLFCMHDAALYHFGILTSNVHMAWMRAVCGRLEMRYSYSNTIVYNNFPWPNATEEQKAKIGKTAQAILDARALYPDSSLADLYDDLAMPVELRKAHQDNDRAVMEAYGWKASSQFTESMCVAELFKLYQELTKK